MLRASDQHSLRVFCLLIFGHFQLIKLDGKLPVLDSFILIPTLVLYHFNLVNCIAPDNVKFHRFPLS